MNSSWEGVTRTPIPIRLLGSIVLTDAVPDHKRLSVVELGGHLREILLLDSIQAGVRGLTLRPTRVLVILSIIEGPGS